MCLQKVRSQAKTEMPNNKLVWYESINNLNCTFGSIRLWFNTQILRADPVKRRFILHRIGNFQVISENTSMLREGDEKREALKICF